MIKYSWIVFILMSTFSILAMLSSVYVLNQTDNRLCFLMNQLDKQYPGIMTKEIEGGYFLSSYLKDTIVNIQITRTIEKILFVATVIAIVVFMILFFRSKSKPTL